MPDKLTDVEIKKALECVLQSNNGLDKNNAIVALDLINRQEALIDKLEKVEHFADKTIATQKAEIERLKTECGLAKFDKYKAEFEEFRAEIKAEAYKEVFEKVKNYIDVGHLRKPTEICFSALDVVEMLDNLLNELVGVLNGKDV